MPGLNTSVQAFDRDSGIPDVVWDVLRANAARANVILPHAEKVFSNPSIVSNEFWLVYSKPGTSSIQFVLSCADGQMGKYPVFIVPILPISELTPELLEVSMEAFCDALLNQPGFGKRRVYSVFSIDLVAKAFASAWKGRTGINCIEEPYYDATFTMCSDDTLVRDVRPPRDDVVIELRLAVEQDAQMIGQLCYEFAATSPPFVLSTERANQEAALLIANHQVWVLEIQNHGEESDIACIVAVTRKSNDVAAITKVYTTERWRGNGCAERLVRRVCKELLKTHEKVVLYVGVENPAKKVYDRVGFQGLAPGSPDMDGVEHWLEIGFDRAEVDLGHW